MAVQMYWEIKSNEGWSTISDFNVKPKSKNLAKIWLFFIIVLGPPLRKSQKVKVHMKKSQ